jgi:predicted RNA methylase
LSQFSWKNERLIELGCGTGLVGIYLSLLGAEVVVTDVEHQLLDVTRANVENYKMKGQLL